MIAIAQITLITVAICAPGIIGAIAAFAEAAFVLNTARFAIRQLENGGNENGKR